jgi:hypothetical protein
VNEKKHKNYVTEKKHKHYVTEKKHKHYVTEKKHKHYVTEKKHKNIKNVNNVNNTLFMSSFELLKHLQCCLGSNYSSNLNHAPCRILKSEEKEIKEFKDNIFYIPPRLGYFKISLEIGSFLPEPSAYFSPPHTFIKSYLFLSSLEFYETCYLPKKAKKLLNTFLKEIFLSVEKRKGHTKKLIQKVMYQKNDNLDTDPEKSIYFSEIYKTLFSSEENNLILVQSSKENTFLRTIPSNLPKLTKEKTNKNCYILLQFPDKTFAPYGKIYIKDI